MIHHGKKDKQIERERGEREARKREIEQEKETQVLEPNTGRENHQSKKETYSWDNAKSDRPQTEWPIVIEIN